MIMIIRDNNEKKKKEEEEEEEDDDVILWNCTMGLFASFIGCKVDRLDFLGGIPLKFENLPRWR